MEGGRYARREDEQRYVAASVPDGARSPRRVEDRYLDGTRLRLRLVTDEDGTVVRKLGHKVRDDPARPSAVWHTTCYLDDAEYGVLATLPAMTLVKRRRTLTEGCADEFDGALEGLVLVEGAAAVSRARGCGRGDRRRAVLRWGAGRPRHAGCRAPRRPREGAAAMRAFVVARDGEDVAAGVRDLDEAELEGDVLVDVEWSCLNFKDAMVAAPKSRVARRDLLVGGVDAVGTVTRQRGPGGSVTACSPRATGSARRTTAGSRHGCGATPRG